MEVARRARVSQGTVWKLINTETKHSFDTIKKICDIIGLNPTETFVSIHGLTRTKDLKTDISALDLQSKELLAGFTKLSKTKKQQVLRYVKRLSKDGRRRS